MVYGGVGFLQIVSDSKCWIISAANKKDALISVSIVSAKPRLRFTVHTYIHAYIHIDFKLGKESTSDCES